MTKQHTTDELEKRIIKLMDSYWGISGHNLEEKRPLWADAFLEAILDWHNKELKSFYEHIKPEKLAQTKEEETSDWFYGYGWNAYHDTLEANAKEILDDKQ